MSDQLLMASGIPFSEAYPMRREMEKEIAFGRANTDDFREMKQHICTCGGNCPDCKCRTKREV